MALWCIYHLKPHLATVKKLIQTLKNIWNIEELRQKILFTLLLVFVYRVGSHIVLPGIDVNVLNEGMKTKSSGGGLLDLFDTFAGGAFSQASIFALGIMPYITASIFMQLMTILVPQIKKIQNEGESGRKKINQWTRYLTVGVTIFQALAYLAMLRQDPYRSAIVPEYANYFAFSSIVVLTAGTMFVMWLGEKITDRGLGNGTSLIIMIGILARFPNAIFSELGIRQKQFNGVGGVMFFLVEVLILVAIIMGLILLIQGTRRVPVNYAKQVVGNRQFGGARQFLPLKVNSAGVMPIIFAQAILYLPMIIVGFNQNSTLYKIFQDHTSIWYMITYSIMVIGFTFLYTALIFNPRQMAEELKRNNGFIPGVKPGQPTADYIGGIMDRITLPGAVLLAVVGILPGIMQLVGVVYNQGFSNFFGGTSLLIMVGVILDTLQQIETQLLMREYDGLMSSGRIQGRQGATTAPNVI
jgi:preprotein translocase subunit SecY